MLFCAATAVAIAARPLRIPYTVALVVVGTALGMTRLIHAPPLTRDLLFTAFLPGLVFESAFHMEMKSFVRNTALILGLAVPGVVVMQFLIALPLAPLPQFAPLGLTGALLFAAIVVATDPVAVLALLRELKVPARLATVIEGESLLNDGTGVVIFGLMLAIAQGAHPGAGELVFEFFKQTLGGALIGAAFGLVEWQITRRLDDPLLEITLTVIAAYGSFGIADQLGMSGVVAAVVAGLVCGSVAVERGMTPRTRQSAHVFWEYVAFALNSIVFLLMGFRIELAALLADWLPIALAWLAVTVARALVLYAATAILRLTRGEVHWRWTLIATWSGLRGALGMTLALSLPETLPSHAFLVRLTFGVVLLTLLVQGLTLRPLLRWLAIGGGD
ncbi:MAG TPA: cation:proton antiporter [Myxococcales bacterium]|nr:cation:proton antiporter [Myxococcales bacterium]